MKRALPGKKSKKAVPARKPAAKRAPARLKSKSAKPAAKPAAKKPAAVKKTKPKTKPRAAKARVAPPKVVRKKVATVKAAKPKRPGVTKGKAAKRVVARKMVSPPVTPVAMAELTIAAPTPVAKPKASRKTVRKAISPALKLADEGPIVPFAIAADAAVAVPAANVPENSRAKRKASQKAVRKIVRKTARKAEFTLPAFLLEGDEPSHPLSGSGEKFALGPTPPLDHFDEAKAPLPESYGTGRLFLTARDPHWLYAHWDFTMQEQFRYNAQSVDRHMVLRLHDAGNPGQHISEVHVHPESRHWFTHVDEAGKNYFTEIGYYQTGRKWKSLAVSEPQRTPPDNISADSTIEFATIPLELPFETMLALLKETANEAPAQNVPLARGIEQIRSRARQYFPQATPATDWTPEQDQALADILATSRAGTALPGSEEFANEKTWPECAFDVETGAAVPLELPSSYVSSFFGGAASQDFWFNVNAELIVYGATDPNATVTFAGKQIPLRPDGSFRFHFALPDGQFELPVTAASADGTDGRAAKLKFTRATEVCGQVAAAPAEPALKPPRV
jgi:hypothetical protein